MDVQAATRVRSLRLGALPVADLGRSYRFYANMFAARLERLLNATPRALQRGLPEFALLQTEQFRFGLSLQYQPLPQGRSSVGWGINASVDDIGRIRRELQERGTSASQPEDIPAECGIDPMLFFLDPDGNPWTVCKADGAVAVGFVTVEVTDLAQAEGFYSGLLGLPCEARSDAQLAFRVGAGRQWLVTKKVDQMSPRVGLTKGPYVAFEVEGTGFVDAYGSLPSTEKYWERETSKVPWDEPWAQIGYFYDPFYNRLALVVP